jgi:hypothetical protein
MTFTVSALFGCALCFVFRGMHFRNFVMSMFTCFFHGVACTIQTAGATQAMVLDSEVGPFTVKGRAGRECLYLSWMTMLLMGLPTLTWYSLYQKAWDENM